MIGLKRVNNISIVEIKEEKNEETADDSGEAKRSSSILVCLCIMYMQIAWDQGIEKTLRLFGLDPWQARTNHLSLLII